MKIKFLSDTHGFHQQEPLNRVDLLIHSGDATNYRSPSANLAEWEDFYRWFLDYPADFKIYVPGNHDSALWEFGIRVYEEKNIKFLINEEVEYQGVRIYGSPYTKNYGEWVYMRPEHKMKEIWDNVPEGIDILVTHGPPKWILDSVYHNQSFVEAVGDKYLRDAVERIKPKIHAFGHVHDNKQFKNNGELFRDGIRYMNNSQVRDNDFKSGLVNKGRIIEW